MTERNPGTPNAAPFPVRDSLWLSKALDGDVLVVVEYAGIRTDDAVDVVLRGGMLSLRQGQRVYAELAAEEDHVAFLSSAPRLSVLEIEYGEEPDDDRFIVHPSARLVGGPRVAS